MRSFVINLDRRPDRYARFLSEMSLSTCTRVSAVDGLDIVWTDELRARVCDWNFIHIPHIVNKVVACCLSHLAVWEMIRKLEVPYAAVFEDDACLIQGSFDLDGLSFPKEFGLIWLNNTIQDCKCAPTSAVISNVSIIPHLHVQYTTEGYIITPAFAGRLCSEIENYLGAVDAHMAQIVSKVEEESGSTVGFQVWPPLICQFDRSDTDVQL